MDVNLMSATQDVKIIFKKDHHELILKWAKKSGMTVDQICSLLVGQMLQDNYDNLKSELEGVTL